MKKMNTHHFENSKYNTVKESNCQSHGYGIMSVLFELFHNKQPRLPNRRCTRHCRIASSVMREGDSLRVLVRFCNGWDSLRNRITLFQELKIALPKCAEVNVPNEIEKCKQSREV